MKDLMALPRLTTLWILAIFASTADAGVFVVNQAWAKPGKNTSEAYMTLMSSEAASLVDVRSSAAKRASLRGGKAKGSRIGSIALPAGENVVLAPNGPRIVLQGLARTLILGARVPLTLTIFGVDGSSQVIRASAEVRTMSPVDAESQAHRHR